jgi:hypothetical protein
MACHLKAEGYIFKLFYRAFYFDVRVIKFIQSLNDFFNPVFNYFNLVIGHVVLLWTGEGGAEAPPGLIMLVAFE